MDDLLNSITNPSLLWLSVIVLIMLIIIFLALRSAIKTRSAKKKVDSENNELKAEIVSLRTELRQRLIDHVQYISRITLLNPVIPGNTPEDTSLEGRNRVKCLDLLVEGLPQDYKAHGIRMAEFLHQLSDYLLKAYGKEDVVTIKIDAAPIILDIESAVSVGLMFNELVSNAIQYGHDPDKKCKVDVYFKERDNKLVINVADNGIGMKVPYIPKYSFGLQLVSTLVKLHKGDLIISSRPGTRIEIILSEYRTAIREVYVTPTRRIY